MKSAEDLAREVARQVEDGDLTVTISNGERSVKLGGKKDQAASKKKPEKYELVPEEDPAWRLLGEVREASHSTLEEAVIALVWENGIKPDRDGHVVLGRAKKTGKLDRKFRPHDFTILLNKPTWDSFPEPLRRALLDHELCHCGVKSDAKGDRVYYTRKHDLEDFHEVVRRHGIWTSNVKGYVDAALQREQISLFTPETRKLAIEAIKAVSRERLAKEMAS